MIRFFIEGRNKTRKKSGSEQFRGHLEENEEGRFFDGLAVEKRVLERLLDLLLSHEHVAARDPPQHLEGNGSTWDFKNLIARLG